MELVSVVILTMGDRPQELSSAINSIRKQKGVLTEVVLVINGGTAEPDLGDVLIEPKVNLGIPGGRNAGLMEANAEYVLF